MSEVQRKIAVVMAFLIFVLFCGFVAFYIGVPLIRFAEEPKLFQQWVDSYGTLGCLIFMGMVVLQVIVAFIPGEPIEIVAGYAFGFWEGTLLTLTGFLLGSWLNFSLVRRFGPKVLEIFFTKQKIKELYFLKDPKRTKVIMFLLMLIPGTPKDFISYFAGLTPLTLKQWLTIVAVARIPSLITSVATGAASGEENYTLSVSIYILTLLISIFGIVYYRRLCRPKEAAEA